VYDEQDWWEEEKVKDTLQHNPVHAYIAGCVGERKKENLSRHHGSTSIVPWGAEISEMGTDHSPTTN